VVLDLTKRMRRQHSNEKQFLLKDHVTVSTVLVIGGVIQSLLFAVLPIRLALLPIILYASYSLITTIIAATYPATSPYMSGTILGRTTAQLPDTTTGTFGSVPAARSILVFHFGVRFNHPLGIFAPGGAETSKHFQSCMQAVNRHEYGILGSSFWRAGERSSQNTLMVVFYFRNVEGLNKFAHDEVHRKSWGWIVQANHKHIGFFHEVFCVSQKAYESIYVNLPPLLMGATSVKCEMADGDEAREERWVSSLVSANTPALRTQFGRMDQGFRDIERASNEF
jgi:hypothetical protein